VENPILQETESGEHLSHILSGCGMRTAVFGLRLQLYAIERNAFSRVNANRMRPPHGVYKINIRPIRFLRVISCRTVCISEGLTHAGSVIYCAMA
jgi:hypothetical protein